MLFIFDKTTAFELAGVADAASKDNTRPALQVVALELDRDSEVMTLRALATDSYMLGRREVTFYPGEYDPAKTDDAWAKADEPIMVDAKEWKKALSDAAKSIGRLTIGSVLLDVTPEGVTVTSEAAGAPEVTLKNITEWTFPKWRSLVKGQHTSADAMPAFNPAYLARIGQIATAKPSDRSNIPAKVYSTDTKDTDMKPWLFILDRTRDHSAGTTQLQVLLMPVRV